MSPSNLPFLLEAGKSIIEDDCSVDYGVYLLLVAFGLSEDWVPIDMMRCVYSSFNILERIAIIATRPHLVGHPPQLNLVVHESVCFAERRELPADHRS